VSILNIKKVSLQGDRITPLEASYRHLLEIPFHTPPQKVEGCVGMLFGYPGA
jgi:hypothetical protein